MTVYNWYKIFNKDEFDSVGLVSKEYEVNLVGVGVKSILVTKGFRYSMVYGDVFLTLKLGNKNPFEFGSHAIYIDSFNDVWLGLPT